MTHEDEHGRCVRCGAIVDWFETECDACAAHSAPAERDALKVEARGLPDGFDYEALIMGLDEEY